MMNRKALGLSLLLLASHQASFAEIQSCHHRNDIACASSVASSLAVIDVSVHIALQESSDASSGYHGDKGRHRMHRFEHGYYKMIRQQQKETNHILTLQNQQTLNEIEIVVPTKRYDMQANAWQTKQINAEQTQYGWQLTYLEEHTKQTIGVLVANSALIATETIKVI